MSPLCGLLLAVLGAAERPTAVVVESDATFALGDGETPLGDKGLSLEEQNVTVNRGQMRERVISMEMGKGECTKAGAPYDATCLVHTKYNDGKTGGQVGFPLEYTTALNKVKDEINYARGKRKKMTWKRAMAEAPKHGANLFANVAKEAVKASRGEVDTDVEMVGGDEYSSVHVDTLPMGVNNWNQMRHPDRWFTWSLSDPFFSLFGDPHLWFAPLAQRESLQAAQSVYKAKDHMQRVCSVCYVQKSNEPSTWLKQADDDENGDAPGGEWATYSIEEYCPSGSWKDETFLLASPQNQFAFWMSKDADGAVGEEAHAMINAVCYAEADNSKFVGGAFKGESHECSTWLEPIFGDGIGDLESMNIDQLFGGPSHNAVDNACGYCYAQIRTPETGGEKWYEGVFGVMAYQCKKVDAKVVDAKPKNVAGNALDAIASSAAGLVPSALKWW